MILIHKTRRICTSLELDIYNGTQKQSQNYAKLHCNAYRFITPKEKLFRLQLKN